MSVDCTILGSCVHKAVYISLCIKMRLKVNDYYSSYFYTLGGLLRTEDEK